MRVQARNKIYEPSTQEKLNKEIAEGKEKLKEHVYAKSITLKPSTRTFVIFFSDDKSFYFLVDKYDEFKNIPNEDLKLAKIGFAGTAICLEKHDLHVSIFGLINDSIKS